MRYAGSRDALDFATPRSFGLSRSLLSGHVTTEVGQDLRRGSDAKGALVPQMSMPDCQGSGRMIR
jgi:hypothetical protein